VEETPKENLEELFRLYARVKRLILLAEELDPEQKHVIAIDKELRDALDHLVRYLGVFFAQLPEEGEYSGKNYSAIIGHLCRAGYDAIDELGISLKLRISTALAKTSNEAIQAAIPNYYPKYVTQIEEINNRIVDSRADKDVGAFSIDDLEDYEKFVTALRVITLEIEGAVPAMIQFDRKQAKWKRVTWDVFLIVLGVLLAVVADCCISHWHLK
jgi:hypothetical protein